MPRTIKTKRLIQPVLAIGIATLLMSGCAEVISAVTVPDVTGSNLYQARTYLENRGYRTENRDLVGSGRTIYDEENWLVCEQGYEAAYNLVILGLVNYGWLGERCP